MCAATVNGWPKRAVISTSIKNHFHGLILPNQTEWGTTAGSSLERVWGPLKGDKAMDGGCPLRTMPSECASLNP